jgi:hypothetical protein
MINDMKAARGVVALAAASRLTDLLAGATQAEIVLAIATDPQRFTLEQFANGDILTRFKADTLKTFPDHSDDSHTNLSWLITMLAWLVDGSLDTVDEMLDKAKAESNVQKDATT